MDAADISFTQAGSGAVTTNLDALLHQKVYTPEMFGAASSPLGTAPGSVADSTNAMQACINALAAIGGGTIQLGPGVYGITTVLISTPISTSRAPA
jgi:polygalacturonase